MTRAHAWPRPAAVRPRPANMRGGVWCSPSRPLRAPRSGKTSGAERWPDSWHRRRDCILAVVFTGCRSSVRCIAHWRIGRHQLPAGRRCRGGSALPPLAVPLAGEGLDHRAQSAVRGVHWQGRAGATHLDYAVGQGSRRVVWAAGCHTPHGGRSFDEALGDVAALRCQAPPGAAVVVRINADMLPTVPNDPWRRTTGRSERHRARRGRVASQHGAAAWRRWVAHMAPGRPSASWTMYIFQHAWTVAPAMHVRVRATWARVLADHACLSVVVDG